MPNLCQLGLNFPRTAVGNQALSILLWWDGDRAFFVTHALIRALSTAAQKNVFVLFCSFFLQKAQLVLDTKQYLQSFGRRKKINCT